MLYRFVKYYVRIYRNTINKESWQTLGPYDYDIAIELMCNYLKKGMCCWIEDVKISE